MKCEEICVPFVPSDVEIVREGLKVAGLKPNQVFLELGSGDGRNLILASKEFGAYAIGYELDPKLVEESKRKAKEEGVEDRVKIVQDTFMNAEKDIAKANVVYFYLTPSVNELIKPMLLKYPVKILSFRFPLSGLEPTEVIRNNLFYYDLQTKKRNEWVVYTYEELVKRIVSKYKPYLRMWDKGIVDVRAEGREIVVYTKSESPILPLYLEGIKVRVVKVH